MAFVPPTLDEQYKIKETMSRIASTYLTLIERGYEADSIGIPRTTDDNDTEIVCTLEFALNDGHHLTIDIDITDDTLTHNDVYNLLKRAEQFLEYNCSPVTPSPTVH